MLARGGMAEVFLARMSGVGGFAKLLVIKRILPHLNDDPEFHEMFLNEGRVAARLNHSNLCQVYELGEVDSEVFLAMEYLEGLPWSDLVRLLPRGRGVELRVTATVLGQICEGLRYAHEFTDVDGTPMPIVHRDVSPQNLFITTEGVCKLLDFGVSKVLTEGTRTRTGMLKGKLPYMAPEQIRGEPIDARADVFSMGVVLWEALTGARLFQRDTDYQIWRAITEQEIPRVTARVPGLPPQIDHVVARALDRTVAKRYPSIRAFAVDLREVADRVGGPFDTSTLSQVLKSLGAGKLAERNEKVSRAIGRPARASDPPPLPAAITQPNPIIEPSDTHSIALRDASVKLKRKPRGWRIAVGVGVLAIGAGVIGAVVASRDASAPSSSAAIAEDAHVMVAVVEPAATSDAPGEGAQGSAAGGWPGGAAGGSAGVAAGGSAGDATPSSPPDDLDLEVVVDPVTPTKRRIVRKPKRKAEPVKAPAEAVVAEPGFYSVDSKPYATIYIDGKSYGETPLFKVSLAPGKHRVRAVRADGKSKQLTITIAPGKLFSSGTLGW
ncbi:MAG TPA: protein kinase [Kofleriaceae bacterium]